MTALILLTIATTQPSVPEHWIDQVEQIESGGRNVYGDGRKARGIFQFHRAAWKDTSKIRKAAGLAVYPYNDAFNRQVAREYARSWLTYIYYYLSKRYCRPARLSEVWLAYNLGIDGFRRYNYNMRIVEDWRREKALTLID